VPHTVAKISTKATTFLYTSPQSKVFTQSYGLPKLYKSQFWEFWDSHLGVPGQNDIWVLVPWPGRMYITRGRWWLPPSSGRGESCESVFARGLSVHQKCFNYALTNLLFGLCRHVWVIDLLVILPSPYLGAPIHPSTPKVLQAREHTPTPSPSVVFTFGLAFESIQEPGGASPWALLPNRWAFGLVWFHGHIVACPQMSYQVVFGHIGCIAPINPINKFGPIPCPMDTLYGNWGKGNRIWSHKKTKIINLMQELTFWMKFISSTMKVLHRSIEGYTTWWGYYKLW
jgi:hypothetical protein